jgi:hypothetical protein
MINGQLSIVNGASHGVACLLTLTIAMDLTFHPRFDCKICPTNGILPTQPLFPIRCGILSPTPLCTIRTFMV